MTAQRPNMCSADMFCLAWGFTIFRANILKILDFRLLRKNQKQNTTKKNKRTGRFGNTAPISTRQERATVEQRLPT